MSLLLLGVYFYYEFIIIRSFFYYYEFIITMSLLLLGVYYYYEFIITRSLFSECHTLSSVKGCQSMLDMGRQLQNSRFFNS